MGVVRRYVSGVIFVSSVLLAPGAQTAAVSSKA
jgi:hypothetical protein